MKLSSREARRSAGTPKAYAPDRGTQTRILHLTLCTPARCRHRHPEAGGVSVAAAVPGKAGECSATSGGPSPALHVAATSSCRPTSPYLLTGILHGRWHGTLAWLRGQITDRTLARAGLPRSRHRPCAGQLPGQAQDSINGYWRSVTGVCHASRSAGSAPFCSRWAACWSCSYQPPGRAAGSARAIPSRLHRGGDRVRAARRRVEDWHGAVASDTARGSGLCTSGVIMSQGFPMSPLRD